MLSQLKLTMTTPPDLKAGSYLAPMLQGALMELISPEYADELHISALHPYSQYVTVAEDAVIWTISTLDKRSRSELIGALSNIDLTEINLRQKNATLHISGRDLRETDYDALLNHFYLEASCSQYITVDLLTPTSFKSNGRYVIFPTAPLILNSLVRKYDSFAPASKVGDELLSDYIAENTDIVEYSLRSTKFPLEGITIPSFIGSVKIKCRGNKEFISLVNMLLKFGEYSGVGIKNSMGMGAMKVRERGGLKYDRKT